MGRYDCKIKVDGEFKIVLTFDIQLDENSFGHATGIMAQVLQVQVAAVADSTEFNEAFTREHHVPSSGPNSSPFLSVTPLLLCQLRTTTGMDSVSRGHQQKAPS